MLRLLTKSGIALSTLALIILSSSTIGQIYSQMPYTIEQGKYVVPEFGLEMDFSGTMAIVTETQSSIPGDRFLGFTLGTTAIYLHLYDSTTTGSGNSSASPINFTSSDSCKPITSKIVNINGKDAIASDIQSCKDAAIISKAKSYFINLGNGKSIFMTFNSNDPSGYNSALETFEGIVKTIKFTTPTSLPK